MILAKLKEATKQQHDGLESTVDVMNRLFSLDDYKTLLAKFYRFYSVVEPLVAAQDTAVEGFDFSQRLKTPLLEKDLAALGILDAVRSGQKWSGAPVIDTPAKAFGTLYVMEGATLGGQVINRHLKEHLGLTPENGGVFFNGYGQMTGPMWKAFGASIEAFAASANADDEIVAAAKDAFTSFKQCFEEPLEFSQAGA